VRLVVATYNPGKLREIREILGLAGIEAVGLDDVRLAQSFVEDGDTFLENARKKARVVAEVTGLPALADDSGLAVRALEGRPGLLSARYAGPGAADWDNNRKLLAELEGLPPDRRGAAFVCAMVVVVPGVGEWAAEGRLKGRILESPRGQSGFGYDPLFYVESAGQTLAEMEPGEKNRLSHRGQALRHLLPRLSNLAGFTART
jgi:XTP/dITP diphosphohydrolase